MPVRGLLTLYDELCPHPSRNLNLDRICCRRLPTICFLLAVMQIEILCNSESQLTAEKTL